MNYPKSILCGAKFIFHLKSIANYKKIDSFPIRNNDLIHAIYCEARNGFYHVCAYIGDVACNLIAK